MTYDFEDYTKDKQREKNDQFDLLDYTPCSRFDLIKHFYNLVNLTKEHVSNTNYFFSFIFYFMIFNLSFFYIFRSLV